MVQDHIGGLRLGLPVARVRRHGVDLILQLIPELAGASTRAWPGRGRPFPWCVQEVQVHRGGATRRVARSWHVRGHLIRGRRLQERALVALVGVVRARGRHVGGGLPLVGVVWTRGRHEGVGFPLRKGVPWPGGGRPAHRRSPCSAH